MEEANLINILNFSGGSNFTADLLPNQIFLIPDTIKNALGYI